MSAPPLMGRNAILTIALATLAVAAHGVPVTTAHTHSKSAGSQTARHAPARTGHSQAHPHAGTTSPHRAASTRRHPATQAAAHPATPLAAHKPTPEEVGRAAGLKIRNQLAAKHRARKNMYRSAVLRRTVPVRHQPELMRASFSPSSGVADETDESAANDPETRSMSGTTHYEAVDADSGRSDSVATMPRRSSPPAGSQPPAAAPAITESEIEAPVLEANVPQPSARRIIAPRPVSAVADSDDDTETADSNAADAAPPAGTNAVHPSFGRHAQVKAPDSATVLDGRVPAIKEVSGENSSDYNAPEDTRLKAETEEASLTIARGYMPAPLRGNRASLERQNARLEAEGLERIEDEDDLASRIAHHLLVPVPASDALVVNGNLPVMHRYCRPWTARFLSDLATAHQAQFHRPLEVSSAVRTVQYQKKLMHVNGNAAPAEGDVVSPHLTGATIDIAKDNLSRAEMAWMRRHLLALEADGKIDVEEEFQQACFHITVYKNYLPTYRLVPHRSQTPSQARKSGRKGRTEPTEVADSAPAQGI